MKRFNDRFLWLNGRSVTPALKTVELASLSTPYNWKNSVQLTTLHLSAKHVATCKYRYLSDHALSSQDSRFQFIQKLRRVLNDKNWI